MRIIVICINNYTSLFMRLARYAAQNRRLRRTVLILTCAIHCSREYRISAFCHVMLAWAVLTLPQVTHATTPPPSRPSTCTEIPVGATQDVTAFGVCKKVTNTTSKKVCALTATSDLWTSWYTKIADGGPTKAMPGVSVADCVTNTNGQCGSAQDVVSPTPPTANLCSAGTATDVNSTPLHRWSCMGSGTGTNVVCEAKRFFSDCKRRMVCWGNCSGFIMVGQQEPAVRAVLNTAPGCTGPSQVTMRCGDGVGDWMFVAGGLSGFGICP